MYLSMLVVKFYGGQDIAYTDIIHTHTHTHSHTLTHTLTHTHTYTHTHTHTHKYSHILDSLAKGGFEEIFG